MMKIYSLIGQLIEQFQILESALLLYGFEMDFIMVDKNPKIDKLTLGRLINKLKISPLMKEKGIEDILEYFRKKRNDVVHKIFIDKNNDDSELLELEQFLKDLKLINKTLAKYVKDI